MQASLETPSHELSSTRTASASSSGGRSSNSMGPVCNNNYGTFVSVEAGREGGDEKPAHPAPAFEQGPPARSGVEHRLLRDWRGKFGLQLRLNGAEVVVLTVDDDVARVRGLCEGDVVTHINGQPPLGSLETAHECMEKAGDSLTLRVKSNGDGSRHGPGHRNAVQHVVRQGDSVESLADLYGTSAEHIRVWNRKHFPVGEPGYLFPGQVLTLSASAVSGKANPAKSSSHDATERTTSRRRRSEGDRARRRMLYDVREGDSLKTISARLGVREGEVRRLNRSVFPVGEAGALVPGQTLTVFVVEREGLREERGEWSAIDEGSERAFMRSIAGRKTRTSLGFGTRGAGIMGT